MTDRIIAADPAIRGYPTWVGLLWSRYGPKRGQVHSAKVPASSTDPGHDEGAGATDPSLRWTAATSDRITDQLGQCSWSRAAATRSRKVPDRSRGRHRRGS